MRHRTGRAAYTLVELLIVIAIILVLASLTTAAAMALIMTQHERSTKFTMRQVEGARKKHWEAVVKEADKDTAWKTRPGGSTIVAMANGDDKLGHVLYVKFCLKRDFPTSFAEALNPVPLPPNNSYVAYLNNLGITAATLKATPDAHESAACLYMALSMNHGGVKTNLDQLNVGVRSFPAPNGQIKALVDDWANPFLFARWPVGDSTLDSLYPVTDGSVIRDPEDRDGLLTGSLATSWWNTQNRATFEQVGHSVSKNGQPYAYYLVPVLVSGGRDGKMGISLDGTLTPTSAADAADNIYSYKLERE
jgi:prepilin-type N-terminal cleavage/methylation domain-containing protein